MIIYPKKKIKRKINFAQIGLTLYFSDEEFLNKYGLKANDAILVEEHQMGIFDDMAKNKKVDYVAGGAAQNTIRGAQYVLPPKSTAYIGCVGDDEYAKTLCEVNAKAGVETLYMVSEVPTGKCAVVITGHQRSLCTLLGAACEYKVDHMRQPEVWKVVEGAEFYYIGGYHLAVSMDSIAALGEEAVAKNKVFTMNVSAPYMVIAFKDRFDQALTYCDYLIGNESEMLAYAEDRKLDVCKLLCIIVFYIFLFIYWSL